jgi:AcrR family transcriptional regulator
MGPSKRGRGGRPTKDQSAALDDSVLDGARSSFSKYGISNTSIDEIATTLGISKHTIYRRYSNKAALLDAVVERDMESFRAALVSAKEQAKDPIGALREIAFRYVELGSTREHASFYLSIMAEAARSSDMRSSLARWSAATLEPLMATIVEGQQANLIRERDPNLVLAVLIDLLEGANNTLRLGDDTFTAMIDWKALVEQRWNIFRRIMIAE